MPVKPNECTGVWDCVVKVAKFVLWAGAIPVSLAVIGWRLGLLSSEQKNTLDNNGYKI